MADFRPPDDERLDELLGAYALDAVDADERRRVEELLRADRAAAREVDEHRETAAALAWSVDAPPAGLWDRIVASLEEEQPPAPSGELAKVLPHRRRSRVVVAVLAAAAALVVAVVGIGVLRRDDGQATMRAAMEHALDSPDARRATLRNADGSAHADVVIDGDGRGFVAGDTLPPLTADRTYQLWGVLGGDVISLGVLGDRPGVVPFSAAGDLTALVITNEAAGGVATNGNPTGALQAAIG